MRSARPCSVHRNTNICVKFKLDGLTGDQVRALGTLSHLVEIASEFPPGCLEGLESPNAALAYAMQVLGSEATAYEGMRAPAVDLNQQRPIDVLETEPQLVMELLARMEYGVY